VFNFSSSVFDFSSTGSADQTFVISAVTRRSDAQTLMTPPVSSMSRRTSSMSEIWTLVTQKSSLMTRAWSSITRWDYIDDPLFVINV
jgi:hypothetical protein